MDYELAKQLRNAGVPQEKKQGAFVAPPSAVKGDTVNLVEASLSGGIA
jgi:hypothetical protein